MADAVDGFVAQSRTVQWHTPAGDLAPEASTSNVVGAKLHPRRRLTGDETNFLKHHAQGPIKMTLPAPSNFWVVSWRDGVSTQAYASRSEMLQDVTRILRHEVEALVNDALTTFNWTRRSTAPSWTSSSAPHSAAPASTLTRRWLRSSPPTTRPSTV